MDVNDFLKRLEGVRQSGNGWEARCPAHNDHDPSLSVAIGDDRRILVKCHKRCSTEEIVSAMGLTMSDLFQDKPEDKSKRTSVR